MRGIWPNGDEIKRIRRLKGLTQEQLAVQADCDVKTIRRAEKSEPVDLNSLSRIASGLGVEFVRVKQRADDHKIRDNFDVANERLITLWFNALRTADVDQMVSCFERNSVLWLPGLTLGTASVEIRGRRKIKTALAEWLHRWRACTEIKGQPTKLFLGEQVFVPFDLKFRPEPTVPFRLSFAMLYARTRHGRMNRLHLFWDSLALFRLPRTKT